MRRFCTAFALLGEAGRSLGMRMRLLMASVDTQYIAVSDSNLIL
jgi:hypothetical protein